MDRHDGARRAGRLWRSSHRERQIGVGIGWPGAGSGRGGG